MEFFGVKLEGGRKRGGNVRVSEQGRGGKMILFGNEIRSNSFH